MRSLTAKIEQSLGPALSEMSDQDKQAVVVTILAIVRLQTKFADQSNQWSRAERKALRFLKKHLGREIKVGKVITQMTVLAAELPQE